MSDTVLRIVHILSPPNICKNATRYVLLFPWLYFNRKGKWDLETIDGFLWHMLINDKSEIPIWHQNPGS